SSTPGSLSAPFVIARNGATQQPERSAPSPGLPRFARMTKVWDEDELTRRGPDGPARHHQHRRGFDLCPDAIGTGARAPAMALRRAHPGVGGRAHHGLGYPGAGTAGRRRALWGRRRTWEDRSPPGPRPGPVA